MRDVVLLSVPHTGTTFIEELLFAHGWHGGGLNDRGDGRTVHRGHIYDPNPLTAGLRLARQLPLICPIRHPYLTEEAWRRRNKTSLMDLMILGFYNLYEKLAPLGPFWMPVDSDKREECLKTLSEGLETPFITDWEPKRVVGHTYDMTWQECAPSEPVARLARDMQPLLERFYG